MQRHRPGAAGRGARAGAKLLVQQPCQQTVVERGHQAAARLIPQPARQPTDQRQPARRRVLQQGPHGVLHRQPVGAVGPPRQRAGVQVEIDQLQIAVGVGRGAQCLRKLPGKLRFEWRHTGLVAQRRGRHDAEVDQQPVDALHPAGLAQRVADALDGRQPILHKALAQRGLQRSGLRLAGAGQLDHQAQHAVGLGAAHKPCQPAARKVMRTSAASSTLASASSVRVAATVKRASVVMAPVGRLISAPVPATGTPSAAASARNW